MKNIIKAFSIDAVGFIPPTVKRETQFMNELKKRPPIKQKLLSIIKAKTSVMGLDPTVALCSAIWPQPAYFQ